MRGKKRQFFRLEISSAHRFIPEFRYLPGFPAYEPEPPLFNRAVTLHGTHKPKKMAKSSAFCAYRPLTKLRHRHHRRMKTKNGARKAMWMAALCGRPYVDSTCSMCRLHGPHPIHWANVLIPHMQDVPTVPCERNKNLPHPVAQRWGRHSCLLVDASAPGWDYGASSSGACSPSGRRRRLPWRNSRYRR